MDIFDEVEIKKTYKNIGNDRVKAHQYNNEKLYGWKMQMLYNTNLEVTVIANKV